MLDRFVGNLAPVFHSSRLGIDLHYTPPGIRGEPRNSVVVTYGYGFGDDHVNRVLRDMLSIPSTHLVIISFDDAAGRLPAFHDRAGNEAQMTLLVGPHFGDLKTLMDYYLPKAAIDRTTWRMIDLLNRRTRPGADGGQRENGEDPGSEGEG